MRRRRRRRNPFGISSEVGLEVAQDIFSVNPDPELEEDLEEDDLDEEDDLHDEDDDLDDEDDDLEDDLHEEDELDDDLHEEEDLDDDLHVEEGGGIASYYNRNPWRHNPDDDAVEAELEAMTDQFVNSYRHRGRSRRRNSDSLTTDSSGRLSLGLRRRRNSDSLTTDSSGRLSLGLRRRRNSDSLTTDSSGRLSLGLRRRRNSGADLAWGGSPYQPRWNSVRRRHRRNPPARTARWTHPNERKTAHWAPVVCPSCGERGCDGSFCSTPYHRNPARTARWTHPTERKTSRWAPAACPCGERGCDGSFCSTPYRRNPLYRSRLSRRSNPWGGSTYRRNS